MVLQKSFRGLSRTFPAPCSELEEMFDTGFRDYESWAQKQELMRSAT